MSGHSRPCPCPGDNTSEDSTLSVNCECPRDENDIVIHKENCLMYKHETIIFPPVSITFIYPLIFNEVQYKPIDLRK